ncbi:transporter [Microbacterium mangrovi]|uniref:Transporter n=1 Tax=Microbacterium mangrovi TaxID=1348253 RepID=A0A0B2A6K6_9MICO|nr:solute carrier family 23 protein [Microbacterium mangrovi]KHK97222.1 transporter [Microbacterium mangrovi]
MTTPKRRFAKPTGRDVVSGFVTGLFSIPEGMAYASIGGFAAPLGLWSGIVPTIVGSIFARTVLMVTTLTSAIALTSHSVLTAAGLKTSDVGAIATLTVLSGIVMLILGLLKLGSVMAFVSTAVMTGFTAGIALQIMAGVIKDATGYSSQLSNTIGKIVDALLHVGQWDPWTVAVAAASIVIWFAVRLIKPLKSLATIISLVVTTAIVALAHIHVELVSDIAAVPRSLPPFTLPQVSAIPELAAGAVAIALVALAQAAGIGSAVPNPDGTQPNMSKDFTAQGLANIAGGFFSALPTGGSMSRTGVATSAGAQTRWTGIFAGAWLAVIVLVVGPLAGLIPMAVIGGLMLVIGGELLAERRRDIVLVTRTSMLSLVAMIATFLATTQLPLQQAIFLGAGLSILLTAVEVTRVGRLLELVHDDERGWHLDKVAPTLASGRTTVLHYSGAGFFSEVPAFRQEWPDMSDTADAAVVLSLRGSMEVPSATFLKMFGGVIDQLHGRGIPFYVCGVTKEGRALLEHTKLLDKLGEDHVVVSTATIFQAIVTAYARAEAERTAAKAD